MALSTGPLLQIVLKKMGQTLWIDFVDFNLLQANIVGFKYIYCADTIKSSFKPIARKTFKHAHLQPTKKKNWLSEPSFLLVSITKTEQKNMASSCHPAHFSTEIFSSWSFTFVLISICSFHFWTLF